VTPNEDVEKADEADDGGAELARQSEVRRSAALPGPSVV
jgi:hypothetical protein